AKPRMRGTIIVPDHEHEPDIELGDTVRVVHPESRNIFEARVLDIVRELTEDGERWEVGLNAELQAGSLIDDLSRRETTPVRKQVEMPTIRAEGYLGGIRLFIDGP